MHGDDLFEAQAADPTGRMWTYMPVGPFPTRAVHRAWVEAAQASDDPLHFAVRDVASGRATGTASFLRIDPAGGVIEVGYIAFTPALQRTVQSTEAMALMMGRVFDELGYRRYEWKCDSLNEKSRRAAERLGFSYEGLFRQAIVYKGRSRDTAWYAIIDREWPRVREAFERWLDPGNFDATGQQRRALAEIRAAL
jgi:RimJ/RimL family protein N-acetyltransferase